MEKILERIKIIISDNNLSKSAFAREIEMEQTTVNNQILGKRAVSLDLVVNTLVKFPNISAEWLIRGEGAKSIHLQSIEGDNNNVAGHDNNIKITGGNDVELLKQHIETLKLQIEKQSHIIDKLLLK